MRHALLSGIWLSGYIDRAGNAFLVMCQPQLMRAIGMKHLALAVVGLVAQSLKAEINKQNPPSR
jgi:hypothetical protein